MHLVKPTNIRVSDPKTQRHNGSSKNVRGKRFFHVSENFNLTHIDFEHKIDFSQTKAGYFIQDDGTPAEVWGAAILPKFGLKLPSWTQLLQNLNSLNVNAPQGTSYKLFILGRHGEGYRESLENWFYFL